MAKKRGEVTDKPLSVEDRARLKELEDENRRLRMEREILKKAAAWFCESEPVRFVFIQRMEEDERRKTHAGTNSYVVDL